MNIQTLIDSIQTQTEWLQTTGEDEIECISLENLQTILSNYFEFKIKLTQQ